MTDDIYDVDVVDVDSVVDDDGDAGSHFMTFDWI